MLQTAKVIAAGAHSLQFMGTSPGQITDLARAFKYFRFGIVSDSSGENPLFTDGSFIFPPGGPVPREQRPIPVTARTRFPYRTIGLCLYRKIDDVDTIPFRIDLFMYVFIYLLNGVRPFCKNILNLIS